MAALRLITESRALVEVSDWQRRCLNVILLVRQVKLTGRLHGEITGKSNVRFTLTEHTRHNCVEQLRVYLIDVDLGHARVLVSEWT